MEGPSAEVRARVVTLFILKIIKLNNLVIQMAQVESIRR